MKDAFTADMHKDYNWLPLNNMQFYILYEVAYLVYQSTVKLQMLKSFLLSELATFNTRINLKFRMFMKGMKYISALHKISFFITQK